MTMTEQNETPTVPAKPKRKAYRKRAAAAASEPAAQKPSEMDGISVTDCPLACTPAKCVISGVGICGHPHKGGLQAPLQNPDSLRRLSHAKRMLGKAKLDLQNT